VPTRPPNERAVVALDNTTVIADRFFMAGAAVQVDGVQRAVPGLGDEVTGGGRRTKLNGVRVPISERSALEP
jgi:hypothetical protein